MRQFLKSISKLMIITSCIPIIGLTTYLFTTRINLLSISLLLYFSIILGSILKYIYNKKHLN